MIKLIFLIKKKTGLTVEEFMRYYEDQHAGLALTFIGSFLLDYRRSYPQASSTYLGAVERENGAAEPTVFSYDSITEMWFRDREAVNGMFAVLSKPEVRRVLGEDEARFIDIGAVVMLECIEGRSAL